MTLTEKLDMLDLNAEERIKAEEKFLVSLSLVDDEEFKEVINRLKSCGVSITKARELKIIPNLPDEISKKFSILSEIHETDIYKEDPRRINLNVIDIYKKIKYCKQTGMNYKTKEGNYEPFLFSESEWQKTFTQEPSGLKEERNDDIVTLEPLYNPEATKVENEAKKNEDFNHVDIQEYLKANKDMKNLEAEATKFADIRKELEGSFNSEWDSLNNFNPDDVISFNDIEVENYGMGR